MNFKINNIVFIINFKNLKIIIIQYNLKKEIDKWNNFSSLLRKGNRELFLEMFLSSYKYSFAINAKGKEFLEISLTFDQHKMILINAVSNITNNNNENSVKE